jgi:hypothetical protein
MATVRDAPAIAALADAHREPESREMAPLFAFRDREVLHRAAATDLWVTNRPGKVKKTAVARPKCRCARRRRGGPTTTKGSTATTGPIPSGRLQRSPVEFRRERNVCGERRRKEGR